MTETSTYHRAGRRAALAAGAACIWLLAAAPSAVAQAEDAAEDSLFVTMLLPLSLALIMVSLGLSLTPADFRRILQFPRGVGIGLVNLLVVSPLLAFAVAALFGLEAALAVGLVLLGASPGGTTANLLTHLARGDTALSVTMTAISSVAATVTIPLYLGLAIDVFDADFANDPEIIGVATRVFFITVVPLSIGMWIRSRWTSWAVDVEDRAKRIALALFVLVVGGTIVNESDAITDSFAELALATLTLNLAAMTISFNVARLARLSRRQATAIAMELGVYSVFMFVTAGVFARLMYKRNAGEPLAAAAAIPEPGPVEPPTRRTESGPPLGPPVAAPAPTGSRRNAVTPGGVVWAALWGVAVLLVVAAVVITAIGIT